MSERSNDSGLVQRLYTSVRRIRRVEEEVARIYPSDKIKSPVHLSIGQEAISVGVIDHLEQEDVAAGSYRCHAVYIAKGSDLKGMMAELYGKAAGCAGGKGGSMHLIGDDVNVLGASAVVGTHIPQAAGYAFALKREGKGRVCVVFFGDGATEEGCVAETLNFAALHKLPILFVCENNGYAIHTGLEKRWATNRLCERVETYGIPTKQVADSDILALHDVAGDAIARIRAGEGPMFIEAFTYRWKEHVGPSEDFKFGYREESEMTPWVEGDQMTRLGDMLDDKERADIDAKIEAEIAEAVDFAESAPEPDPRELYTYVYA